MATPLSAGETSLTRLPSIKIDPLVISSRPAMDLSNVDLPQPDGNMKKNICKSKWTTLYCPPHLPKEIAFN